jgi:SpoVK/Ycf46/Vps4 family AAA+-type ATPase
MNESVNICPSDIFQILNDYVTKLEPNDPIKNEIVEANILYNNGKFYYSSGESVGALVSYSCATVLLNSIKKHISSSNKGIGAQPAIQKPSPREAGEEEKADEQVVPVKQNDIKAGEVIKSIDNIMGCCLEVIKQLQGKVQTAPSGGGSGDEDAKLKDWDKVCKKINPLVFKKGSDDCIFYSDVAGLQKEKDLVDSSLIYPLVYPNLYPSASKGILIYGPPGTGKTYLVKAAVNELQKKDPNVGVLFFAPSPGNLKGKYVGETEKLIEEHFRCAHEAACASEKQCSAGGVKKYISIIFMDEMDAIAPNRDRDTTGLAVNSVNTLLQMMDGVSSFSNVCVVGATNYPWNLDDAIIRRFDTQVFINVPTEDDLLKLFKMRMNKLLDLNKNNEKKHCAGKKEEKTGVVCKTECEDNVGDQDREEQQMYKRFDIEFYKEFKRTGNGAIGAIVRKMAKEHFSNSDLNRFIKAAITKSGELAVKKGLFVNVEKFASISLDNPRYISSLTSIIPNTSKSKTVASALNEQVSLSIKTLMKMIKRSESAGDAKKAVIEDIIELNKPKLIYIEYTTTETVDMPEQPALPAVGALPAQPAVAARKENVVYIYINVKCLTKTDNFILSIFNNNPEIKDTYIKLMPKTMFDKIKELAIDSEVPLDVIIEYKKNILGVQYENPLGSHGRFALGQWVGADFLPTIDTFKNTNWYKRGGLSQEQWWNSRTGQKFIDQMILTKKSNDFVIEFINKYDTIMKESSTNISSIFTLKPVIRGLIEEFYLPFTSWFNNTYCIELSKQNFGKDKVALCDESADDYLIKLIDNKVATFDNSNNALTFDKVKTEFYNVPNLRDIITNYVNTFNKSKLINLSSSQNFDFIKYIILHKLLNYDETNLYTAITNILFPQDPADDADAVPVIKTSFSGIIIGDKDVILSEEILKKAKYNTFNETLNYLRIELEDEVFCVITAYDFKESFKEGHEFYNKTGRPAAGGVVVHPVLDDDALKAKFIRLPEEVFNLLFIKKQNISDVKIFNTNSFLNKIYYVINCLFNNGYSGTNIYTNLDNSEIRDSFIDIDNETQLFEYCLYTIVMNYVYVKETLSSEKEAENTVAVGTHVGSALRISANEYDNLLSENISNNNIEISRNGDMLTIKFEGSAELIKYNNLEYTLEVYSGEDNQRDLKFHCGYISRNGVNKFTVEVPNYKANHPYLYMYLNFELEAIVESGIKTSGKVVGVTGTKAEKYIKINRNPDNTFHGNASLHKKSDNTILVGNIPIQVAAIPGGGGKTKKNRREKYKHLSPANRKKSGNRRSPSFNKRKGHFKRNAHTIKNKNKNKVDNDHDVVVHDNIIQKGGMAADFTVWCSTFRKDESLLDNNSIVKKGIFLHSKFSIVQIINNYKNSNALARFIIDNPVYSLIGSGTALAGVTGTIGTIGTFLTTFASFDMLKVLTDIMNGVGSSFNAIAAFGLANPLTSSAIFVTFLLSSILGWSLGSYYNKNKQTIDEILEKKLAVTDAKVQSVILDYKKNNTLLSELFLNLDGIGFIDYYTTGKRKEDLRSAAAGAGVPDNKIYHPLRLDFEKENADGAKSEINWVNFTTSSFAITYQFKSSEPAKEITTTTKPPATSTYVGAFYNLFHIVLGLLAPIMAGFSTTLSNSLPFGDGGPFFTWFIFITGLFYILSNVLEVGYKAFSKVTPESVINDAIKYAIYTTVAVKGYFYYSEEDIKSAYKTAFPQGTAITKEEMLESVKTIDILIISFKNQTKVLGFDKILSALSTGLIFNLNPEYTHSNDILQQDTTQNNFDKSMLCNLNIPMDAFYYATTVVKSTYNPEVAPLLEQYYSNKDKFLEEFNKKNKGK